MAHRDELIGLTGFTRIVSEFEISASPNLAINPCVLSVLHERPISLLIVPALHS